MQHKVVIQNLNRHFLTNQQNSSLEKALEETVKSFIKPLDKPTSKIVYTLEISALDSDNPVVTLTLKLRKENISIGQAHLKFSRSVEKDNVTAKCSNFFIANLMTTQNFTSITEHALTFLTFEKAGQALNHAKNLIKHNEKKEKGIKTFFKKPSILESIIFLGKRALERISGEKNKEELQPTTKILENLTKFLKLYGNGKRPVLEDITNFRKLIDELKETDSSYKTTHVLHLVGRGLSIALLLSLVAFIIAALILPHTIGFIAGIIFAALLIIVPEIFFPLVAALFLYGFGIIKYKGFVDTLYSLANDMEADKTLEDEAKFSIQEETKEEVSKDPSQQELFLPDSSVEAKPTTNLNSNMEFNSTAPSKPQ